MTALRISELADRAGVKADTLRFYEREGLLPAPPRQPSGYRAYPPEAVGRVRFIKRAQDLGFTLKEIAELLALRLDPGTTCADVRRQARAKLDDTRAKIRDLRRIEAALLRLTTACPGRGLVADCPILEALDQNDTTGND